MQIAECRGNDRAIGECIGEALRDDIQRHIAGFLVKDVAALEKEIGLFKASLSRYVPGVLEQMQSAARSAHVAENQLLALNLPAGIADARYEQGCTNLAFADGPHGPLWGKNNDGDFPPGSAPVRNAQGRRPACILKLYPDYGIPVICITFCGWFSGGDMINAEGVATGHSSVGSRFQQSPQHAPILQWLYQGMFKFRRIRDYVEHLTALPLRGKGYSQLAIDREGGMVSGELACPLAQMRWPAPGERAMNCVNHYQLPQLAGIDARTPSALSFSKERQTFLESAAREGDRGLEHMQRMLRHHGAPSICRHGGNDQAHTEYSMIGILNEGKLLYYHGYPCSGEYRETGI